MVWKYAGTHTHTNMRTHAPLAVEMRVRMQWALSMESSILAFRLRNEAKTHTHTRIPRRRSPNKQNVCVCVLTTAAGAISGYFLVPDIIPERCSAWVGALAFPSPADCLWTWAYSPVMQLLCAIILRMFVWGQCNLTMQYCECLMMLQWPNCSYIQRKMVGSPDFTIWPEKETEIVFQTNLSRNRCILY